MLSAALRRRALSVAAKSQRDAVEGADIIVLAAPLAAVQKMLPSILKAASASTLVIDVGGTKAVIVNRAKRALKSGTTAAFVAGHPMAGSEKSGPLHATKDLFQGRPFALYAPAQRNRRATLRRATSFVRALGAHPVISDPVRHDRIIATTSALPQLVAIALAVTVADAGLVQTGKLAGPGLEGSLRLAASPYRIWRDGLSTNKANVRGALMRFATNLRRLTRAVATGDDRFLARSFGLAARAKRHIGHVVQSARDQGRKPRRH